MGGQQFLDDLELADRRRPPPAQRKAREVAVERNRAARQGTQAGVAEVPSLSFPAGPLADPAEQAGRFEAVRLFAERARQGRPRFMLTGENSRNTCPICGRRGRVVGRWGE
jgi:hypothetical protein